MSTPFHPSWPAASRVVVERAVERYGGWRRWETLGTLSLRIETAAGLLLQLKGVGKTFTLPHRLDVEPRAAGVHWYDANHQALGSYTAGRVTQLDARGKATTWQGAPAETAPTLHRDAILRRHFPRVTPWRPWGELHARYFFGYAFVNYVSVPFNLPALEWIGATRLREAGECLDVVEVRHPRDAHVHSRRQRYGFDSAGLLRRNDYVADVLGPWAMGAHETSEFTEVDGLPVPRHRRVLPRLGASKLPGPAILDARFGVLGHEAHDVAR